jgi:flagellar protein FliS
MSTLTASPNAYRETAVLSATPERGVVMLYDGAHRFLFQATVAMREGKIELCNRKLARAEDIIAHNLDAIYDFCLRQLRQARFDRDPAVLEHVSSLLGQLRESWAAIAGQ